MVKVTGASGRREARAWHGSLLLFAFGLMGAANACGGRTVWVEENPTAGEAGDAGSAGYGGDSGGYGGAYGGYGGDYGGGPYGGTYGGGPYGGTGYGGTGYGGAYGGTGYGGTYAGSYPVGGVSAGGTYPTGGVNTGGVGGSVAGKGGYGGVGGTGKGGCGAASGSGGSAGSPALGKACASFCPRYPYAACGGVSDFEGPRDCLSKCQNSFGLSPWCDYALVDFLNCATSYLNPNAMCIVSGGQCYGPGCVVDAVNACAQQYVNLLDCQDSPRPLPPCPPPPNRPLPPGCSLGASQGTNYCMRDTACPMGDFMTECFLEDDLRGTWLCDCFRNGVYEGSVDSPSTTDVCATGAQRCGYY